MLFNALIVLQCNKALEIDHKNVKALYRRGQSRLSLGDFENALTDFNAVREIEPENKAALNQITICKQKIKDYNEQQKKVFANMFTKFAKSDKQVSDYNQILYVKQFSSVCSIFLLLIDSHNLPINTEYLVNFSNQLLRYNEIYECH